MRLSMWHANSEECCLSMRLGVLPKYQQSASLSTTEFRSVPFACCTYLMESMNFSPEHSVASHQPYWLQGQTSMSLPFHPLPVCLSCIVKIQPGTCMKLSGIAAVQEEHKIQSREGPLNLQLQQVCPFLPVHG